jgi:hypothetical protein
MTTTQKHLTYLAAGSVSGAVWFGIATLLDSDWAIPKGSGLPFLAALFAGIASGVFISLVFRPLFRSASTSIFILLPLVTLPIAIGGFALLLWLSRWLTGVHFEPQVQPTHELRLIVVTYLVGGLMSIFAPVLFVLALLNQYAMRLLLRNLA